MATTITNSGDSTYTPIYSQTLSSAAASITLSNIPTTYTDLVLVVHGYTANSNTGDNIGIRFNGDAGSNYSWTRMYAVGSAASSRSASQTVIGQAALGGGSASISSITYNIQNYSSATTYKPVIYKSHDGTTQVTSSIGMWRNTSPVTSINVNTYASSVNFAAGSTFTLYGIKAAAAAQYRSAKASGGDLVTTDGVYVYHTFYSSGMFTVAQSLTADYLVVAGGGGTIPQPSGYYSGGGGGGGLRSSVSPTGGGGSAESALALTPGTNYTVIVGAGGAAAPYGRYGIQGNNSSLNTITSIGGGYGSNGPGATSGNAGSGGSGGGAGSNNGGPYSVYSGGSGTSGQGYSGGSNESADAYAGGAGGGAGGAGGNGSGGKGGTGGAAVQNSISGTATYYAGGGWGGKGYYGSATIGDSGTGYNQNPFTGMGGVATNAAGQSGIVIVRYAL